MTRVALINSAPYTDTELLEGIFRRDHHMFTSLFNRFYPGQFQLAMELLNNTVEAEDIVSDTFAKYWKEPVAFQFMGELANWLKLTTRNACLDILRHRSVKKQYAEQATGLLTEQETESKMLYADILQVIHHHIAQLPDRSREVFTLRYIEGLSNEEIAGRLAIKNQSVRDHLARAVKVLRQSLAHNKNLLYFFLVYINTK